MSVPSSIPYSSIIVRDRGRTQLFGIDALADAIHHSGLIQPLVLCETPEGFMLDAGGRRHAAIGQLIAEGKLESNLYHGVTSDPTRAGFLVRSVAGDNLDRLIIEIQENLNRDNMDWRDEIHLIVKAWREAQKRAREDGEVILQHAFGAMLGCGRTDLSIANRVYDHFVANPKLYEDVTSISGTLSVLLRNQANEIAKIALLRTQSADPLTRPTTIAPLRVKVRADDSTNPAPSPSVEAATEATSIPLSSSFFNTDAYEFLRTAPPGFCDHVICDPDYAIDADVINSGPNNRAGVMLEGVAQRSAEDSLAQLMTLFPLAFRALPDRGFFVFWYALDHHEKLQAAALAAGFRVQAWPILWSKQDFRGRSNSAPNHNFPKSYELAMVCRKPNTTLAQVQTTAIFTTTGSDVVKALGHPFAKPFELWSWIYRAVAIPGQIVYDPFVGTGSSAIAAIRFGLRPIGTEINPDLYANLIVNLKTEYIKRIGPSVQFS